ncbi:hypothetical protein D9M68_552190 [compost metagenome]
MLAAGFGPPLPETTGVVVQAVFVGHANGAEHLVGDGRRTGGGPAYQALGHGGAVAGIAGIHLACGIEACNLGGGGLGRELGDHLLDRLELADRFAELHAGIGVFHAQVQHSGQGPGHLHAA